MISMDHRLEDAREKLGGSTTVERDMGLELIRAIAEQDPDTGEEDDAPRVRIESSDVDLILKCLEDTDYEVVRNALRTIGVLLNRLDIVFDRDDLNMIKTAYSRLALSDLERIEFLNILLNAFDSYTEHNGRLNRSDFGFLVENAEKCLPAHEGADIQMTRLRETIYVMVTAHIRLGGSMDTRSAERLIAAASKDGQATGDVRDEFLSAVRTTVANGPELLASVRGLVTDGSDNTPDAFRSKNPGAGNNTNPNRKVRLKIR